MFGWKDKTTTYSKMLNLSDFNPLEFSNKIFLEYFHNNSIIYGTVNMICSAISNIKISKSSWQFELNKIMFELLIFGNCFLYKNNNKLEILDFFSLSLVMSPDNKNLLFYKIGNSEIKIPADSVLHLKYNYQNTEILGISPLKSLQINIETHLKLNKFLYQFIDNNCRPNGILSYKGIISAAQKNRISYDFKNIGMEKDNNFQVLDGEFSWQQIGSDFQNLKILEIKENLEITMCNCLGIPPILFGIKDAKFDNFKNAMEYFQQYTIKNQLNSILNKINIFLNLDIKEEI